MFTRPLSILTDLGECQQQQAQTGTFIITEAYKVDRQELTEPFNYSQNFSPRPMKNVQYKEL